MSAKIATIKVHNVMGVKDIQADLTGHHLWLIGGKNAQGKTSVLKALVMAICGPRGCDYPSEPLRRETDSGWVQVKITDSDLPTMPGTVTIERSWERREDGEVVDKLRIVSAEGYEAPTPQTILNDLFNQRGFNPLSFLSLKPKDQVTALQKVVGLDFTVADAKRATLYHNRTAENKLLEREQSLVRNLTNPGERINVAPLHDKIVQYEAAVNERTGLSLASSNAATAYENARKAYDDGLVALEKARAEVKRLEAAMEPLDKKQIAAHQTAVMAKEALDSFVVTDPAEVRAEIKKASAHNELVDAYEANEKQRATAKAQAIKAEALTRAIAEIDEWKAAQLENAKWPVPGLRFSGDSLELNGVPLDQCSTMETTDVSFGMAVAGNPHLRLMVIPHGESLDDAVLDRIAAKATEMDYQVLVEFMTRGIGELEDRCQVVMEAGEVKKAKQAKPVEPAAPAEPPMIAGSINTAPTDAASTAGAPTATATKKKTAKKTKAAKSTESGELFGE